ncbi:MAG: hypothetical protein A2X12_02965 [Bacteroidetes bacterium GWE2_29_8]|nr:MAG: hypothetical protein A2X12_02965 [Bacteroidetes bacterium GWE2_29_8]OFY15375.1 MAG: hypothetical protein A2X02_02980 [Bacteroidetes bacterium GWF2_29_10]
MVKRIDFDGILYAIIIPYNFKANGITFFTPDDFSQQLAYLSHPKGKVIEPHIHNFVIRQVSYTSEVLFVRKGVVKVNFYNTEKRTVGSELLKEGDVILLTSGGHGFEFIEESELIEVKQGPYIGEQDKIRFQPLD